jgi:hypothetical protein
MGSDWKNQLAETRGDFPPGKGEVLESAHQSESEAQPEAQDREQPQEILDQEAVPAEKEPDINIPQRSPLYILYAANYDLDPLIPKLYPEGKQQYLNALLRAMEQGQNSWPESISNREEALEPLSEEDIKNWFEGPGKQALAEVSYSNPEQYLREILQQEGLASIGTERAASVGESIIKLPAGESPAKPADVRRATSRFREAMENMDNPEFKQRAANLINFIKAEYGGWEEFLQYAGNVTDIAHRESGDKSKNVHLNVVPAYIILGNEILGHPQRAEQFKEFERLCRLSVREILGRKLITLPEGFKDNKPGILRAALLKCLKEHPLPSDTWESAKRVARGRPETVRRPAVEDLGTGAVKPEDVKSAANPPVEAKPEQFSLSDNHADVLAKILARAQKRAAARLYDPEEEAGII